MSKSEDPKTYFSEVAKRLSDNDQDSEYEFWVAPGILESIKAGEFDLITELTKVEREELKELISGIIGLIVRRHCGDEIAYQQLNIIYKFLFPKKYEVSNTTIEQLSKKYQSGHLTRGWALRELMYRLSDLVVPTVLDSENVLKSPVQLLPQADIEHPLYPLVKRFLEKRGTTLQMLAIRIYMEMSNQTEDGGTIDERTLKRDLQRLRQWEESDPEHMRRKKELTAAGTKVSWKALIPVRKYSESWIPSLPENEQRSEGQVETKPQLDKKRPPKK
jgi:hypothetical protein